MWRLPQGNPKGVHLGAGGEFFSEENAEGFTPLRVKPNHGPQGSQASLVEETNGSARTAMLNGTWVALRLT